MKLILRTMLKPALLFFLAISTTPAVAAWAGCPWTNWNSSTQGIVDSNAAYFSSILPARVAEGTTVRIDARFPQVRFFNFTIYHKGKLVDHIADASLYPVEGGTPSQYVASIPDSNNYTDNYRITIKYQDVPSDPGQREPNTLYAGADSSVQDLLIMRLYLPNAGSDQTGGAGLPELTQVNPDGSSSRFDSVSGPRCGVIAVGTALFQQFPLPIPFIAPKMPVFKVVSESAYNGVPASTARYSNFDSGYAYSLVSTAKASLILVRSKMPVAPAFSNQPEALDTRYFSFCEYGQWNRVIVGCLADTDVVPQADGYFNIVLSEASNRPTLADTAYGYNWMAALASNSSSILAIRQILADPAFPGSYQAVSAASDPMAALGDWAPQVTYCDTTTFANNALSGGGALFTACSNAYAAMKYKFNATNHKFQAR